MDHHRAGRVAQAERICRELLEVAPEHAGALHLSGVIAAQSDAYPRAAELLDRAVAAEPNDPYAWSSLGNVRVAIGDPAAAIEAYERSLALMPENAATLSNYGNALKAAGRLEEAVGVYRRAIALAPERAPVYSNLGNALMARELHAEALAAYRRALELDPGQREARRMLEAMGELPAGGH